MDDHQQRQEMTTIRIQKQTAKRIKKLKNASLETYDEIISRILDQIDRNKQAYIDI